MRENEYLSMAQEMLRSNDLSVKRIYFYNAFEDDISIQEPFRLPLVSYQILISWKLLGQNLWGPRLLNIFFALFSIISIYYISLLLFGNINISLFCAFLLAIMPLGVFFSRNLQPESPAFFFMLLGSALYLRFASSFKKYNLLLAGIAFSLSWLYESRFLIGVLPLIFCFPWKAMAKRKVEFLKSVFIILLSYAAVLIYIIWLKRAGYPLFDYKLINALEVFRPSYWRDYGSVILWYIKGENYTLIYSFLACCGICLAVFKNKGQLNRYIIGWVFAMVIYAMLFPAQIHQNSFAQMPFLGLVCIASAYVVSFVSAEIKRYLGKEMLIIVIIFVLALSIHPVYQSLFRMYGTAFLGVDVAGESLKEFTESGERIFLFTHPQGYGIARYTSRFTGSPATVDEFKHKEEKYRVRIVCIYPGEYPEVLKKDNPLLYAYIEKNYRIKEVGLTENPNRLGYLILEKGKTDEKSIEDALKTLSGKIETRTIYKIWGRYIFFYTIRPLIDNK